MTPLSVVIITYNEEKNIGRCLESVKEIADEIIVVDSLSTDGTKAICASYNVTFIEQRFLGYIEQKHSYRKGERANVRLLQNEQAQFFLWSMDKTRHLVPR